jgi:hypothetical protein
MLVAIRIKSPLLSPRVDERPRFATLRPRGSNRGLSFFSSLGLHVAAVWLINSTVQAVNARRALLQADLTIHVAHVLEMPSASIRPRLTDPVSAAKAEPDVHFSGSSATAARAKARTPSPKPASTPQESASAGDPVLPAAKQGKRFLFPVEINPRPAKQVLVQMEVPPDLKLKSKNAVPEVLLWQLPAVAKPKPQILVAHNEEPPVRQAPAANPQLSARNREQELAELRHAAAPVVPAPPVSLPVANTTPIRMLDEIAGTRLPNVSGPTVPAPEAVHVISLPDVPVPQARMVVLPPENQGAPSGFANGGGGRGASNTASNDSRQSGVSQPTVSKSGASNAGAPEGSHSLDSRSEDGGAVPGRGVTGRGRDSAPGVAASGEAGSAPPNTIRIVRPREGKYNVVVLGSSNLDAYPEAAGLLSGKVVYSVYIRAGGRKEWILQYCLPKEVEQTVKLRGSAVPIEAPYPFVIYRPDLTLLNDPEYLIVHGFINATGRFERLSVIGDLDSAGRALLMVALDLWEFRPASRDGAPSAVEVALIIPREPT